MNKEYIASGKTIEEAIETACQKANVDRDDVSIEVLETPSKGFLGLGATLAKVKVTCEVPDEIKDSEDLLFFVKELVRKMGVKDITVDFSKCDNIISIFLSGKDAGVLIGRRGETLDSLQYLISLYANKNCEDYVRIHFDIEGYREKRQKTLEELAKRLAVTVVKTKRNIYLEPMQAYERRIIHAVLQDFNNVTTYSTSVEPKRKVVIAYQSGFKNNADNGK